MEVTSHCDITESSANQKPVQSECISVQPTANGTLLQHSTDEAPLPLSERPEDADSGDDFVTDSCSTDVSHLLPKHKGVEVSVESPPICSAPRPVSPPPHHHHQRLSSNQKHLSSTRSPAPTKTDAAHIKEVAGDAVGDCLVCGVGGAWSCDVAPGCCCCVEAVCSEAACSEEACQAVLDCGVLEDCCGSSDCLEVCLECCSICFPS
ncbi:myoD family inhibitor domain-containing protein isoform X2 [Centropristis striata]|uniref:myoD family inhibitor domain-containing protein isoform X2 n=1 Tax=Centropristis striata TaxID=184440 RepID=UPI0027E1E6AB|nr:myoD family inhibitor domain-containing protein isoform X2 [Centropristis striata]